MINCFRKLGKDTSSGKIASLMRNWFIAGLAAIFSAVFLVGQARTPGLVSSRWSIFVFGMLWVGITPLAYRVIVHFTLPRLEQSGCSPRARRFWLAGALTAGLLLVWVIPIEMPPAVIEQKLVIQATGENNPKASAALVKLDGLYKLFGPRINFTNFTGYKAWQSVDDHLIPLQLPSRLSWQSDSPETYRLVFITDEQSGIVDINWNGARQRLDLYSASAATRVIILEPRTGYRLILRNALFALCSGVFLGLLLFHLSLYLVTRSSPGELQPVSRWCIARYALGLAAVWLFFLLVFWPGMMSPDSIGQWKQAITGRYDNGHPLFHTLNLWLLSRLWPSPAIVALVQIAALALVSGIWFYLLRKYGAPRWVTLALAVPLAILPPGSMLVITLWKDVAYSIAVLALSAILFEISMTQAAWLRQNGAWVLLGVTAALVALYRYNGIPVALAALAALPIFYRTTWRQVLPAGLLLVFALWVVSGPLTRALEVNTTGSQQVSSGMVIHPIAAHLYFGTPLTQEEQQMLSGIRPLNDFWSYHCYSVNPTTFSPLFNHSVAVKNQRFLFQTFLRLARSNPLLNLKHMACSSSAVWRVIPAQNSYMYLHTYEWSRSGEPDYVAANDLDLTEQSFLPGLLTPLKEIVFASHPSLIWRPAFYFYLGLFGAVVFAMRRRSWHFLLFFAPIVAQSVILALVTFAQDFRYQLVVYLVSFFSVGAIFVAPKPAKDVDKTNGA